MIIVSQDGEDGKHPTADKVRLLLILRLPRGVRHQVLLLGEHLERLELGKQRRALAAIDLVLLGDRLVLEAA
jgi:hypothetical protein